MKTKLIWLLNISLLFIPEIYSQRLHSGCLVKEIKIGTGRDLSSGILYPYSSDSVIVSDSTWRITMLPTNTLNITPPFDAKIIDPTGWIAGWAATGNHSRAISFLAHNHEEMLGSSSGFHKNYNLASSTPKRGAMPIRFTRKFYVDADSPQEVTFGIYGHADNIMFIRVDAVPGQPIYNTPYDSKNIHYNPTTPSDSLTRSVKTLTLAPGSHTLDIDLYDVDGGLIGINVWGTITADTAILAEDVCARELTIDVEEIMANMPITIMHNLADSAVWYVGRSRWKYGPGYLTMRIPVTHDDHSYIYAVKTIKDTSKVAVYAVQFFPEGNSKTPFFYGREMWINFQDWHVYGVWYDGHGNIINYLTPVKLANADWEQCAFQNDQFYLDSNERIAIYNKRDMSSFIRKQEESNCFTVDSSNSFWDNSVDLFNGLSRAIADFFNGGNDFLGNFGKDSGRNGSPGGGWEGGYWEGGSENYSKGIGRSRKNIHSNPNEPESYGLDTFKERIVFFEDFNSNHHNWIKERDTQYHNYTSEIKDGYLILTNNRKDYAFGESPDFAFDFTKNFEAEVWLQYQKGFLSYFFVISLGLDSNTGSDGNNIHVGKRMVRHVSCDGGDHRSCKDNTGKFKISKLKNGTPIKLNIKKVNTEYEIYINDRYIQTITMKNPTGQQLKLGANTYSEVKVDKLFLKELD